VPRPEDPRLRLRLRELAEQRRRFGYRRLQVLLVREGWEVNHKRVYRLYVEEKLSLRRKRGGRRRKAGARVVLPAPPTEPDQLWTMDFATDAFASGRRFRTLNLMDGFDREALEIEVDTSLGGVRVVRVLEGLKQRGRKPAAIVIAFPSTTTCWQALCSAPPGLRSGPASNNDISDLERREESRQYPSGVLHISPR
jgi:putative transposase